MKENFFFAALKSMKTGVGSRVEVGVGSGSISQRYGSGDKMSRIPNTAFLVVSFWACRAGTRDFCSALAALVGPVQNIFSLTVRYTLSIPFPHRPASWAGSRGSPVS
jgi:hypothetical protein